MKKLSTFKLEVLIEDPNIFNEPKWLEILDFKFHTTGEYPMVTVWITDKDHRFFGNSYQTYTLLNVKGFRVKK